MRLPLTVCVLLTGVLLPCFHAVSAAPEDESPMPASALSPDRRLTEIRHLNMHYEFPGYPTLDAWKARAEHIRRHILVSCGLWPLPRRTPLRARVFGKIVRDGYSIEKVCFESYPGFYVTGNLYRPVGKKGPFPGIVSPHGHWAHGRLEDSELGSIPGRCINFARQGYVTFAYDMVGKVDSLQVSHTMRSPLLDVWGISVMGLQLWDSIRAVDFIMSLKDVDPNRIGATGCSGGGTQTFMLMAVDDRIKVAAPVNMISAYMQGGCNCENAPGLRADLYNVEIGAMMAPRPLLMVSATGDWTAHTPREEYPDIRSIYALYGAADRVETVQIDAPHNYNRASREAVYTFFAKWLRGDRRAGHVAEIPFQCEPPETMRVFPGDKLPSGALDEARVAAEIRAEDEQQIAAALPRSAKSLAQYRGTFGAAYREALLAAQPAGSQVRVLRKSAATPPLERAVIGRTGAGDRVNIAIRSGAKGKPVVLLVASKGIAAWFNPESGKPAGLADRLIAAGCTVAALDCFLPDGTADPRQFKDINFPETYNRTDTADRVQDILTAIAYLQARTGSASIRLAGTGKAGLWTFLACGLAHGVDGACIDLNRFDNSSDAAFAKDLYVPALRYAGDFTTAAALAAPTPLLLHNAGATFRTQQIVQCYRAAKSEKALTVKTERAANGDIARWLVER